MHLPHWAKLQKSRICGINTSSATLAPQLPHTPLTMIFSSINAIFHCFSHSLVDILDSVGLRDNPAQHGATLAPGPSGANDAYLLSTSVMGVANSDAWSTVFSHFPREFSLLLHFRRDSTNSNDTLFRLFEGSSPLIAVDLQRTALNDRANLIISFPGGVTTSQEINIDGNGFNLIVLKLEGEFLSIYVNCRLDSFLKLSGTPNNITSTPATSVSLFGGGYVVSILLDTYVLRFWNVNAVEPPLSGWYKGGFFSL